MTDKFYKLVEIVRKLRKECPWDREQTHSSLRRCLLEETYEVLDALDVGDMEDLKKELGDLLLQVIFHSVMAEENNKFSLEDVVDIEVEKLIKRHPHVFGNVKVSNSDEVKQNWEKYKIKEGRKSILEGIPIELPALFRAYRVQEKAAKVGFDWQQVEPVYEKILEEIEELKTNIQKCKTGDEVEDEFGDVLFALVNYARFLKINPEDALRKTINKFIHRFNKIEQYAQENNINITDMTLEEMDAIWNEIKKQQ